MTNPDEEQIVTHGDQVYGYKKCRCAGCKTESVCTPCNDFYTKEDDPKGLLYCEVCIMKEYNASR